MSGLTSTAVKTEIPLLVVGLDFRIASSALREKLVTSGEDRLNLFNAIRNLDSEAGLLILETCNRLEWVISTKFPGWIAEMLKARMWDKWQQSFPTEKNFPSPYVFTEKEAVLHVLRVVVGMESLATGEAQIAGQFHMALKRTQTEKTSSIVINRLGHIAGRIAKSGFKMGFRSNYRQGIHGLVVKFLQNYFKTDQTDSTNSPELDQRLILVVGMGEIGRKTAGLIEETFKCRVQCINRTIKPSHEGKWLPLTGLPELCATADAIVVATGGTTPIIDEDLLRINHLNRINKNINNLNDCDNKHRKLQKLLIMDIGIPRQVSEGLQQHEMIKYRNIDHLMELGESHEKTVYFDELDSELNKEYDNFKQFCRGREMSTILSGIHSGRLELTEKRIPEFVASQLSDLDEKRRKDIENAMKQFIKDYSNNLFQAFHQTMETYWSQMSSAQSNGDCNGESES